MKASVYRKYGPPNVLQIEEVNNPKPTENEVLVKVHAASVNYSDWAFVRGKPFLVRLMGSGIFNPTIQTLGADIAGTVEAVGKNVTQYQIGDDVFADISGNGWGGFAQYVAIPENLIAIKPGNSSFEEAAAAPQAAVVALQGLRQGQIKPGDKVLIVGASGGIGSFAVQIAKYSGAEVTGVCSSKNIDLVRSLGADHVIDYTREDFVHTGQRYDLILGTAGYRSIHDYKRALSSNGRYVMTGGAMPQVFQAMLLGSALSEKNGKKMGNLAAVTSQSDLVFVKTLIEAGKIKPVIDRRYPLNEVAEALTYYGEGHSRGKIVITMEQ
jgi:NADPH:quinone reductase-like Zn-dependent oxidoreductase